MILLCHRLPCKYVLHLVHNKQALHTVNIPSIQTENMAAGITFDTFLSLGKNIEDTLIGNAVFRVSCVALVKGSGLSVSAVKEAELESAFFLYSLL